MREGRRDGGREGGMEGQREGRAHISQPRVKGWCGLLS